jgi:adenine-specific DNA-methyltransferase
MAKKSTSKIAKTVEAFKHDDAKRKNIPTAEYQSVIQKEEERPKTIKYPRNTDLDPQLVWRGKDEQDWSTPRFSLRAYSGKRTFSFRSS